MLKQPLLAVAGPQETVFSRMNTPEPVGLSQHLDNKRDVHAKFQVHAD